MPSYATPGVYYEAVDRAERGIRALRTDVAGFVGVAGKGPVGVPVLIRTWRQFEAVFGGLHADAYLGYAVKAFFENGGRMCHVVRAAAPVIETVAASGTAQPADGVASLVEPAGFVAGSVVTVSQEVAPVDVTRRVAAIDALVRRVTWDAPLAAEVRLDRTLIIEGPNGEVTQSDATAVQPGDRAATIVDAVAGLVAGDDVRVRQTDRERRRNHRLAAVEAGGARLVWGEPLAGHFDLAQPLAFAGGAAAASTVFRNRVGAPVLTVRASSPGTWGNTLHVRLTSSSGAATVSDGPQPLDRGASRVRDLSGFRRGDLVRLFQAGARPSTAYLLVAAVDPRGPFLIWRQAGDTPSGDGMAETPLPDAFDLRLPISFARLDLSLSVSMDGRLRELFTELSLVPSHPRFAPQVITENSSALIRVALDEDAGPLASAAGLVLPSAGRWLECGRDGLSALTADDLIGIPGSATPGGLAALERVDEVAILVVPDAHLRPGPEQVLRPEPPPAVDPCAPCPPPEIVAPPLPSPVERPPAFSAEDAARIQAAMVAQCERLRDRVAVLDPPAAGGTALVEGVAGVRAWRKRYETPFAALYMPWLRVRDPRRPGLLREVPPGGHVAGLYARFDQAEGVHRPPANGALEWAQSVALPLDDALHGVLNEEGINAIRVYPGRGVRVMGARTLSSDPAWRYVNVRRLLCMVEEAIDEATQWAVFEPNTYELRELLRLGISSFLEAQWRQGAFAGATMDEAFFVNCDAVNNPPALAAIGRVLVEVGVAPALPAEFVVVRVGRTEGELQVTEVGARTPVGHAGV